MAEEGMNDRLRRIEWKLGITDEQPTYDHVVSLARAVERLERRMSILENRVNGEMDKAVSESNYAGEAVTMGLVERSR